MQYLILGANGYVGSYLFRRMEEDGKAVFGTGHKRTGSDKLVYFDFEKDDLDAVISKISDTEKTAIICIAESNIDRCYEHYDQAYQVNVIRMKTVIHTLIENGFHVIYFSSDNVFDGKDGNYTEESPTSAINEYGKMKAEMEAYLLKNEPEVCIFRISKVVSSENQKQNVFTEWENKINDGKIYCIRGNTISFIYIEDIYQASLLVAEKKLAGLYNIVGDEAYSRKELAEKYYHMAEVQGMEIIECGVDHFPFKDARRPLNVSMSNQKFKEETGYKFTSMDEVIRRYIENYQMR